MSEEDFVEKALDIVITLENSFTELQGQSMARHEIIVKASELAFWLERYQQAFYGDEDE